MQKVWYSHSLQLRKAKQRIREFPSNVCILHYPAKFTILSSYHHARKEMIDIKIQRNVQWSQVLQRWEPRWKICCFERVIAQVPALPCTLSQQGYVDHWEHNLTGRRTRSWGNPWKWGWEEVLSACCFPSACKGSFQWIFSMLIHTRTMERKDLHTVFGQYWGCWGCLEQLHSTSSYQAVCSPPRFTFY